MENSYIININLISIMSFFCFFIFVYYLYSIKNVYVKETLSDKAKIIINILQNANKEKFSLERKHEDALFCDRLVYKEFKNNDNSKVLKIDNLYSWFFRIRVLLNETDVTSCLNKYDLKQIKEEGLKILFLLQVTENRKNLKNKEILFEKFKEF